MKRSSPNDLIITNPSGDAFGFVVTGDPSISSTPIEFTTTRIQLPMTTAAPPNSAGGQYDVRDQDGDKAVPHFTWHEGSGQETLDADDSSASRYRSSKNVYVGKKNEMRLFFDAEVTTDEEARGPVITALGKVWMVFNDGSYYVPRYWDGEEWQDISAVAKSVGAITSLATDGQYVYACIPTERIVRGTTSGAWADFSSVAGITNLTFLGGIPFVSIATGNTLELKTLDSSGAATGDVSSAAVIKPGTSCFGLTTAGTGVYWGVAGSDHAVIYTATMETVTDGLPLEPVMRELCPLPEGFVGTSMVGYLGNVYVGGYWESTAADVGQGSIYLISDGGATPLVTIGENPDWTAVPTAAENDNRVLALAVSGKDLYFALPRGVYRWDLDDAGYSHLFDCAVGADDPTMLWTWEEELVTAPASAVFTQHDGTYEFQGSRLRLTHTTKTGWSRMTIPAPTLDDEDGVTLEMETGDTFTPGTDKFLTEPYTCYRMGLSGDNCKCGLEFYYYSATDTKYIIEPFYYNSSGERVYVGGYWMPRTGVSQRVRLTVKGTAMRVYVNDTLTPPITISTYKGSNREVFFQCYGVLDATSPTTGSSYIDVARLSTYGAYAPDEVPPAAVESLAVHKGVVWVPYSGGYTRNALSYLAAGETAHTGTLTTSRCSFHSGSVPKEYHAIEVIHEPLGTCELGATWTIDGVPYELTGVPSSATKTRFQYGDRLIGHDSSVTLDLATTSGTETPIVHIVTELFDFNKTWMHTFVLDVRQGVREGKWRQDPTSALEFLFSCADSVVDVVTRFRSFSATVDSITFLSAQPSSSGPMSEGIVKLVLREAST